jgi:uncharacterized protein (UPF0276 family)
MLVSRLGLGIGWRPEFALAIERRSDLGFVEIVAENIDSDDLPTPLAKLRDRGVRIIPHGISLSLGGAENVDLKRVEQLAKLAERFDAPLVSEHIAFVRAGGVESGHLLPVPRTRGAMNVLVENVLLAKRHLPVPLALENISTLVAWPDAEMSEAEFVTELLERTDTLLLLDIANLWANCQNLGGDPVEMLRQFPLARLAYVHMGGGIERDGVYHDTHAAAVPDGAIDLLRQLCQLASPPGVMLERDDHFPSDRELNEELDRIARAMSVITPIQSQIENPKSQSSFIPA